MKTVIQRQMDLSKVYKLEGIQYISILDGGCTCDNCGKLIANIATLESEGKRYSVGLDCLETLLQQSETVLNWDDQYKFNWIYKAAIQKAKSTRAKITKLKKEYPSLVVELSEFEDRFGFRYSRTKNGHWDPLGFDFTYQNEFKELTLGYLQGLEITRK